MAFSSPLLCGRVKATQPCLILLLLRASPFSSSATSSKPPLNPNQSESASRFLLNNLGFSSSEIPKIKNIDPRFLRTEAPLKRSAEALQLFRSYGFKDDKLRYMFVKCYSVFRIRADEVLKPRLEFIKGLGFSNQELARILSRAPRALCHRDLGSTIMFYREVYDGDANLLKAIKKCPALLASNIQTAREQLVFLRRYGFSSDLISYMIITNPTVLCCSVDAMRLKLELLRNMVGFSEPSKSFALASATLIRLSIDKLAQKLKQLASLGLSEEQVSEIVQKCPSVLRNSCEKVQRIMGYLRDNGVSSKILVKYPIIWGFSFEKRIIPRLQVFKFLSGTWPVDKMPALPRFISMDEKSFMKKYLKGNPEGTKLKEIYMRSSESPYVAKQ